MPDIFISYAREDHEWVRVFKERLHEAGGWEIWWDLRLLPGQQFDDAIESALSRSRCVIVVWSQHSVGSRWVRSEAREGARRGILVPVRIASVTPPLEFSSFETANMNDWHGDAAHPDFVEVVQVLRQAIEGGSAATDGDAVRQHSAPLPAVSPPRSSGAAGRSRAMYLWGGIAVALALVVAIALATRKESLVDPPHGESSNPPSVAPSPGSSRKLPQFSYGTWTLRDAIDDQGGNWSNSTIKFTSQQPTDDGLTLKGTMTWRMGDVVIGMEEFTGHYVDTSRQIFLEGQSTNAPDRLALGTYSAILSMDERTLQKGTWGSTAAPNQLAGVPGHWEARR
jgi:hypothetical protein